MEQHNDIQQDLEYLSAQMEAHRVEGEPPGAFDKLAADSQPAVPLNEPKELPESNDAERGVLNAAEDDAVKSRHRGGQPGNQNARPVLSIVEGKHGLYSKVVTPGQLKRLPQAKTVKGTEQELALLRVVLKDVFRHSPHNPTPVIDAVSAIARLTSMNQ